MSTGIQSSARLLTRAVPRKRKNPHVGAWGMLLPSLVILCAFTVWPMMQSAVRSLYSVRGGVWRFVGLAHYAALGNDPVFAQTLVNTAIFVLILVPVSVLLSLALALLVNRRYRMTSLFRLAFFHPVVLPMVSAASIWLFLYTPDYGTVDQFLAIFGLQQTNWLGQPQTALFAVMVMTVWKQAGYFMVFYLAGLQGLSREATEAAAVDGAGAWRTFREVTWPLLMPTTLFVTVLAVVGAVQMVDQLYVMTQGGPDNATSLLLFYIYQQAFSFQNIGKASALSVLLIAVLVAFAVLQNWLDKKVHYE